MSKEIVALDSWDQLAVWIQGVVPEIQEAKLRYFKGGLAIGAAILIFAERDEVKDAVKKANEGRRGAKWKPYNFVAGMLEKQFGAKLPSAKWMSDCARAAEIAKAKRLVTGDVSKLLGWRDTDLSQHAAAIRDIAPSKLLDYTEAGEASGARVNFDDLVQAVFAGLTRKVENLIVEAQARRKNLTHSQLKEHIEKLNQQFGLLGYAVVPKQGKRG